MIEISHTQAHRLIREGLDRRLPDEQWAAVQAHLENCPECRSYRERYNHLEKDARRLLRQRWIAVRGPVSDAHQALERKRQARIQQRVWLKRLGIGLALFALLVAFIEYSILTAPRITAQPISPASATQTLMPTPATRSFNGVVAFASIENNNSDVRLINASSGNNPVLEGSMVTTNLTASSFNETAPAWSPDGEWLAFLSDRLPETSQPSENHKQELYVMHVAGSRLTRLTDSPDIDWQPPLAWSPDGRYIALAGRPSPQMSAALPETQPLGPRWVYLVPLDGSGPFTVPFSRGASGATVFSPGNAMLAYATGHQSGSLMVYQTNSANAIPILSNDARMLPTSAAGAFDWSLGGQSLIYLHETNNLSEVRLSGEMDTRFFSVDGYSPAGEAIDSETGLGRYRAVSWVPKTLLVAILQDVDGDGCWLVRLRNPYRPIQPPYDLSGLCVDGSFGPSSFSTDGHWLVVRGHLPGQAVNGTRVSFYVLRIPQGGGGEKVEAPYQEKLLDIDLPDHPVGERVLPEPVMRPSGNALALMPRAVHPASPRPAPSSPPATDNGTLYYSRIVPQTSGNPLEVVVSSLPDGSHQTVLTGDDDHSLCPARSPDGQRVAFVSDLESDLQGNSSPGNNLFTMNSDGSKITRLTGVDQVTPPEPGTPGTPAQYGCPVWSADGRALAAVLRYPGERSEAYLALIGMQPDALVSVVDGKPVHERFIPIPNPSTLSLPRWTPDGKQILLVVPSYSNAARGIMQLVAVDAGLAAATSAGAATAEGAASGTSDTGDASAEIKTLLALSGWNDINGLEFSPDGQSLAMLLYSYNDTTRDSRAQLRIVHANSWETLSALLLNGFDYASNGGPATLAWQPDGRIALVRHTVLASRTRATIDIYDPATLNLQTVFTSPDVIYNAVWSPDRHWLAFSAESGLWMLDFTLAQSSTPVAPLLLDNGIVTDLDWR